MQIMLAILIASIIFWVAGMFATKILWDMMQTGGMWDVLFKFGRLRDSLYAKGETKPFYRLLENVLGGCEQCMSFWFGLIWTIIYYIFCKIRIGWITDGLHYPTSVLINMIWGITFWSITAGLGHWFLTYKNKA